MADPRPFPLPIAYGQTDIVKNSGGYLVNLEAQAVPPGADARTPVTLMGSPGMALFCDTGNFPVVDGLVINDACYICTKNAIYRIFSNGGYFKLGSISILSKGRASTNGLDLVVTDGLRIWSYTFRSDEQSRYDTSAAFVNFAVELTSAPNYYPANTVAFMDSYLILDRAGTGQFYNTNPLSLTVDAANFRSAESSPDNVQGVIVDHQTLHVFGRTTTEFHYDSGTGASPFPRVPGGVIDHGAASPYAFAKINNNVCVLSNEGVVYAIQGYTPRPISTAAIEDEVILRDRTTATSYCYTEGGRFYYVLNLDANGADIPAITLVYDFSTGLWHRRRDETYGRHRASCAMAAFGKILVGDFATGKVYHLSPSYYDNAGDPLVAQILSGPIQTAGFQRSVDRIAFDIDVGNGNSAVPSPVIGLEMSRDDGKTWGNQRQRSVGEIGRYLRQVEFRNNGSARDPRFRLTLSDAVQRHMASVAWITVR